MKKPRTPALRVPRPQPDPLPAQLGISGVVYQHKTHIGPLPPPEVLQGYGVIDLSFPARIVDMAEQNAETGRRTAERAQTFMLAERLFARLVGCAFAMYAIYESGVLALAGHDAVASVIAGTTIAGVTAALIAGKTP